jgi:hypothetical protein
MKNQLFNKAQRQEEDKKCQLKAEEDKNEQFKQYILYVKEVGLNGHFLEFGKEKNSWRGKPEKFRRNMKNCTYVLP